MILKVRPLYCRFRRRRNPNVAPAFGGMICKRNVRFAAHKFARLLTQPFSVLLFIERLNEVR